MHGYSGAVYNGVTKIARVLEFSFAKSGEAQWSKPKQTGASVRSGGHVTGRGSFTCEYDPTDTTGQGAFVSGAAVTLNLYPEPSGIAGAPASGDVKLSGTVIITGRGLSSPQSGFDQRTFEFEGVLTQGVV
jgi:hypothetical protein